MKKKTNTRKPCKSLKRNGQPCQVSATPGSDFCYFHDPTRAKEREEAWSKGGKTTMGKSTVLPSSEFRLESLENIVSLIEETLNQVRTGAIEVRIAHCTGYLAQIAIKALEQVELERRIEALEQIVSQRRNR